MTENRVKFIRDLIILGTIYYLAARFGLAMNSLNRFASLIWFPTGIALSSLLLRGVKLWPAIFCGAFVVNFQLGAPLGVAGGIALGNTLEAVLGAFLCQTPGGFLPTLERSRDVRRLVGRAAVFSTIVSATLGVASLRAGGLLEDSQVQSTWLQWWCGDVGGNLTVAPLLLVFSQTSFRFNSVPWAKIGEAFLLAVTLFLLGFAVFSAPTSPGLKYLLFPILLWAAIRFGHRGCVLVTVVTLMFAVWRTSQNVGPFVASNFELSRVHLILYLFVLAFTGLMVGCVVMEKETAKQIAEQANAAKSLFLANMSHEIRTPLSVVMGFAQLLANPKMNEEDRQKAVEAVRRNGESLSRIIDDILDLSKVEAGKLSIERTKVSLEEIIREISVLMDAEVVAKKLSLQILREGGLPEYIETDPQRLRQAVYNVLMNAIKFTDRGSIELRVKVLGADGERKRIAFIIKDSGRGISEEQRQGLFRPFSQADASTTRKYGGTGLGLVLSRKLAQALGGDAVLLESQIGVGSTFMVSFDIG